MFKLHTSLVGTAVAAVLAVSATSAVHAGFDEGVKAYEAGNYADALQEWLPLARNNDPAAMRNVGHLYRRGLGVPKDPAAAVNWYRKAADLGFARAQANLATMYLKGEGVDQDDAQAFEWFEKAARTGHVISQYNLGLMYEYGKGVEKDQPKALGWYNMAAKAGHQPSLDKLSVLVSGSAADTAPSHQEEESATATATAAATPTVTPLPKEPVNNEPVEAAKPTVESAEKAVKTVPETAAPAKAPAPDHQALMAKVQSAEGQSETAPVQASMPAETGATQPKKDPFAPSSTTGQPTVFSKQKSPEPVLEGKVAEKQVETTPASQDTESKGFFASLKSLFVETPAPAAKTTGVATSAAAGATAGAAAAVSSAPERDAPADQSVLSREDVASATPAGEPATPSRPAVVASTAVTTGAGLSLNEQLEMAELAYSLQEYQQALTVWAPLAQQGNPEAQYNLGRMFHDGNAVPVDRVRAYYWWQKASANGSAEAGQSLSELEKSLTFLEKRQLNRSN
ncbi:tetratricopeptide repeat protein [Sneathiella chinensis]|uniref:TPR repeat n=1 Tax=Sneathiella chinensis TaxID=349750 RepID=A0ABQ5U571_9PROT|nr:hypothetical protein [Sneathiella chinensis]GLQ06546.1 hypothetical protein GCM10007924_17670 [Sneathiella chinensis]